MNKCKCGSYAINHDLARVLCDCCWRDAKIEQLKAELADTRDALRLYYGMRYSIPWHEVSSETVDGYIKRIRELKAASAATHERKL